MRDSNKDGCVRGTGYIPEVKVQRRLPHYAIAVISCRRNAVMEHLLRHYVSDMEMHKLHAVIHSEYI